jgi:hypothetical protein
VISLLPYFKVLLSELVETSVVEFMSHKEKLAQILINSMGDEAPSKLQQKGNEM